MAGPAATALNRLLPFLGWLPALKRDNLRPDLEAGLIGAVLILPQAIALATLAGMPPEYGIYSSIFPVIVAALFGSSRHSLSGPNTAMCVLIAYSVAPFASLGSEHYVGFVLALTFMVGAIQFTLGMLKLGAALDFISQTVIAAIVLAVALVIIVSAGGGLLGLLTNIDDPFFVKLYQLALDVPRANGYALAVGTLTLAAGLLARRVWRRYALVVAVAAGTMGSALFDLALGPANTGLDHVGLLAISPLPLSLPRFDMESIYVIKELVAAAFALALLGLMQTVVIARSLAEKTGQIVDTNQEIVGQGLSNLVAPFLSSFAGSGSFNRSAANLEAGARTPMAAIHASLFLALLVFAAAPVIAHISMPTVAGVLILVGLGLIDPAGLRRITRARRERDIFLLTLAIALGLGLNAGVFAGLALSLVLYLWRASTPNVVVEKHTARDGRPVTVVGIDGNLFFGSVRHVERALASLGESDERNLFLLRTDHLTYLDVPGAAMLAAEAKRRRERGDEVYCYVTRGQVLDVLKESGLLDCFGTDHLIHQGHPHPMMELLYPTRLTDRARTGPVAAPWEQPVEALAARIQGAGFLGMLTPDQLARTIEQASILERLAGTWVVTEETCLKDHLILLEGRLEVEQAWSTVSAGQDRRSTRVLDPAAGENGGLAFLGAAPRLRARALTPVRFVLVNADRVDELAGWNQHFDGEIAEDPELARRMGLIRQTRVFGQVPLENVVAAFRRMTARDVEAGETVIRQGDPGETYYLIDTGWAEVIRVDPFAEESHCLATLGAGDGFGEEALLVGGSRNATVTMVTPGRLLVLDKVDFDALLKPAVVEEIAAEEAMALFKEGRAVWLDCRYDLEYHESRLPGARHLPLEHLRGKAHELDPGLTYIAYCRSGRRSKVAAYLLRERNLKALSLAGGLKTWPYGLDSTDYRMAENST